MEGPDVFHLFSIFILDENIEKFVFSDSPPTNGLIVKPEIRHLIDFFFDHYQNILLKIGENFILFGKWFIAAEFGRRTVFTFAFASVDFITRWHRKHPLEFFYVKTLILKSFQRIALIGKLLQHFFCNGFKNQSIIVRIVSIISVVIRQNYLIDTHRVGALHHEQILNAVRSIVAGELCDIFPNVRVKAHTYRFFLHVNDRTTVDP